MGSLFLALQGAVAQGVLWGIMVLGVYITYKLLDIADLTVDGSFALGGCVCAVMMVKFKMSPASALAFSIISGLTAGAVTGVLHTVFEIPAILAGILTQIALWSVNLRVMSGKSNMSIAKDSNGNPLETLMTSFTTLTGLSRSLSALVIGIIISIFIISLLYWFFGTEIGSALRATGNNENMIRALGVNTKVTKLLALMLSNGLVALSGGLICQSQKYADINMGTGAIVIGLAAIVIGEVLMGRLSHFFCKLTSAVVGSAVYFLIRAIVLQLGMNPNDMKLLSAVIVALALCIPVMVSKFRLAKSYTEDGGKD